MPRQRKTKMGTWSGTLLSILFPFSRLWFAKCFPLSFACFPALAANVVKKYKQGLFHVMGELSPHCPLILAGKVALHLRRPDCGNVQGCHRLRALLGGGPWVEQDGALDGLSLVPIQQGASFTC